jgi:hemerythrin-like domain-containing protein
MRELEGTSRRAFIRATAVMGAGLLLPGCAMTGQVTAGQPKSERGPQAEEKVSPVEDLMREHGVLKRVLLVYGEAARRIEAREDLPTEQVADGAGIIRSFIEDYHEKLEEEHLFPRFRKAAKLVDLVEVLLEQHRGGRQLTDKTLGLAKAQALTKPEDRRALADSLRQFIRMYGPHEAREDTVLFPAFHDVVGATEYDDLGEGFEKKEQELFGEHGFEKMVERVAAMEKVLGIYDLRQFTPHD